MKKNEDMIKFIFEIYVIMFFIFTFLMIDDYANKLKLKSKEIENLRLENIELKSINEEYYDYCVLGINKPF